MPDRAPAFRARVEQIRRAVPPDQEHNMVLQEPGSVSELLARAERLRDPNDRDVLYQRAAENATHGGNNEQASTIAEKIVNESLRSSQRHRINDNRTDEVFKALQAGDFDKAEKIISAMSFRSSRMWLFRSLVASVFRKDKPRALQMLDEAYRRAENIEQGVERSQELMMLTGVVAAADIDRAFETMKLAIAEFNRAGFVNEWEKYLENYPGNLSPGKDYYVRTNIGLGGFNVYDFEGLGRSAFERAMELTEQIQMREASALAQLAVCRGALSKLQPANPPKPIPAKQESAAKSRQP
jgi:hypothetical protein